MIVDNSPRGFWPRGILLHEGLLGARERVLRDLFWHLLTLQNKNVAQGHFAIDNLRASDDSVRLFSGIGSTILLFYALVGTFKGAFC